MVTNDPIALHLVDSRNWVADHERNLCNVCTRPFGTFRRKHHCRMCGEVVCKYCTLNKVVSVSPTVGTNHVRVCMSCLINCSSQQSRRHSQLASSRCSTTSETQKLRLHCHQQSPASGLSSDRDTVAVQTNAAKTSRGRNFVTEQHSNEISSQWAHSWPKPPVNANEEDRLRALHALKVLDSEPSMPFDLICDLAKARLSCPMAAVSFVDEDRQWFKASVGLAHKMVPRKIAFCTYAVYASESMVVLDTLQDDRFRKNPQVAGAAGIRFYAAAPIMDPNTGHAVGTVFVLDTRPRDACNISILERLALAASENLLKIPSAESVRQGKTKADNNALDKVEQTLTCDTAQRVASSRLRMVQDCNRRKPMIPISPAASITSSSMSSSSSSNQASLSPSNNLTEKMDQSMSVAAVDQMEELLMRLLTQNTETQQQLAMQQTSLSTKLGEHTDQINKLVSDFDRIKAKIEAKIATR